VTTRTMGEARRCVEISGGSPKTRFSTPDGMPASARQRQSPLPAGASSGALRMTGQPAARAGPVWRAVIKRGNSRHKCRHYSGRLRHEQPRTSPAGTGRAQDCGLIAVPNKVSTAAGTAACLSYRFALSSEKRACSVDRGPQNICRPPGASSAFFRRSIAHSRALLGSGECLFQVL